MTRAQFLNDLYRHLYGMTKEQAEQHLTYYAEMLADRMEEGMTEEEAVAGMEDVETIARRILEEEGLPYAPPDARPATPPEYPDASKLGGGGGKRAYQAPKRDWRKPARIALWSLAAVAVLGALGRLFFRVSNRVPDYPTDSTLVEETAAPEAPYVDDYYYMEAPYEAGYEYAGEEYSFDYEDIRGLDVQWASGTVYVQSWSGDSVQVQEYSQNALTDRTRMEVSPQEDGTLSIRYREGSILTSVKGSKWLTVLVPDGMLEELDVETVSAEVQMSGLELTGLNVSTTSGRISASECYTQTADLTTTSGNMDLFTLHAEDLKLGTTSGHLNANVVSSRIEVSSISGDISLYTEGDMETAQLSSTSGDIWFSLEDAAAQSIGVSSVSGDVSLGIPYDMGFVLDHSTVSGDIINNSYDMDMTGGKYVCNGGGCEIQVETVSGDLDLY